MTHVAGGREREVEGFVRDELFSTDDATGTTKRKIATFFLAVSYDLNPPLPCPPPPGECTESVT
jgi:hypothetical protein